MKRIYIIIITIILIVSIILGIVILNKNQKTNLEDKSNIVSKDFYYKLLYSDDDDKKSCKIFVGNKIKLQFAATEKKWKIIDEGARRFGENSAIFKRNDKIYIVGFAGADEDKRMLIYNYITGEWDEAAEYPYGLGGASFCKYNNEFYVFGGYNTTGIHDEVYKYNLEEDEWIFVNKLPYSMRAATSVLIGNKFHMIGGEVGTFKEVYTINKHLVYDFEKKEYYYETPIPESRKYPSFGVFNNKIYILGGSNFSNLSYTFQNPSDKIYSYDLETKEWKLLDAKLPRGITYTNRNSIVYDDYILLVGGNDGYNREDAVLGYDVKRDKVELGIFPQLPAGMQLSNVMLVEDNLYLFGGFCFYEPCSNNTYITNLANMIYFSDPKINWLVKDLIVQPNKPFKITLNHNLQKGISLDFYDFYWYILCIDNQGIYYNTTIISVDINENELMKMN